VTDHLTCFLLGVLSGSLVAFALLVLLALRNRRRFRRQMTLPSHWRPL
jgi:hypothetical protein